MDYIDLHVHTTASDGTMSPKEVVELAKKIGLRAIAITDHDTTKGLKEGIDAGKEMGMEVVPGCELSVEYTGGQMHIIGLFLPQNPIHLLKELRYLREKRHDRNKKIIEKLQGAGIDISYEDILSVVEKNSSVGRPHIARVLVNKNIVKDIDEAFKKYIGPSGIAYVPKTKFSPKKAISILKKEGATVILAHPFSLNLESEDLKQELIKLKKLGLDGMEVYYSEHTREQTEVYLQMCRELELLVSGGSDFHGDVKKDIHLGWGKGNLKIPYHLLENIKKYRKERNLLC